MHKFRLKNLQLLVKHHTVHKSHTIGALIPINTSYVFMITLPHTGDAYYQCENDQQGGIYLSRGHEDVFLAPTNVLWPPSGTQGQKLDNMYPTPTQYCMVSNFGPNIRLSIDPVPALSGTQLGIQRMEPGRTIIGGMEGLR